MLRQFDTTFMLFAVCIIGMLSFFIGNAIHHLVREDAYGVIGNTVIITAGFIITVEYGNRFGIAFNGLNEMFLYGLAGSFAVLLFMSLLKMASNRFL
jgi:hypothetical protein